MTKLYTDAREIPSWPVFLKLWARAVYLEEYVGLLHAGAKIPTPSFGLWCEGRQITLQEQNNVNEKFLLDRWQFYLDIVQEADEEGENPTIPNIARQVMIKELLQRMTISTTKVTNTALKFLASVHYPKWTEKGPYRKIVGEVLGWTSGATKHWPELDDYFIRAMLAWGLPHRLDLDLAIKTFPNLRSLVEEYLNQRGVNILEAFSKLGAPGGCNDREFLECAWYKEQAAHRAAHFLLKLLIHQNDLLIVPEHWNANGGQPQLCYMFAS